MNGAEFLRLGEQCSFLFIASFRLTIAIGLPERERERERELTSTPRFYLDNWGYCLRNKTLRVQAMQRNQRSRPHDCLFALAQRQKKRRRFVFQWAKGHSIR